MDAIIEFFNTGYNLWYVVGAAVALIAVIIIVAVAVKSAKKKKQAKESENLPEPAKVPTASDDDLLEIDVDNMELTPEDEVSDAAKSNFMMRLPVKYNSSDIDSVVVRPRKKAPRPEPEEKPVVEPEPAEKESSFTDHIYSPEAAKRPGTVQIYIDNGGKYRFRFKTSNGETVGHSQGYTTKSACKSGINAVVKAVSEAKIIDSTKVDYAPAIGRPVFVVYRDRENKFRFRLTASNTSNILASQGYTSKANCINGTKSVSNVALFHNISDDTVKVQK